MILSLLVMIEGFEVCMQLLASGHQQEAVVVLIIAGVFCLCATSSHYNIKNEVKKLKNENEHIKSNLEKLKNEVKELKSNLDKGI
jgi:predicted nuclease with TOPRIM domain